MKKIAILVLSALLSLGALTGCLTEKKNEESKIPEKPTLMTFNESKSYEESTTYESGIITVSDVVLKNATFNGDLTIDKSVGEGDITLDSIKVNGKLIIQGGGANSIHIDNSDIKSMESSKEGTPVRIVVSENTVVQNADLSGHTNLEVSGKIASLAVNPEAKATDIAIQPNSKVEKVEVNASASLLVQAPITDLNLKAESKVNLEAAVENVRVEAAAQNTTINIAKEAEVKNLATETKVEVSGEGKLTTVLTTDTNNVTGNIKAETTTVNENPIQESNKEIVAATPTPVATNAPKPTTVPTKAPATPVPTVEPTPVPPSTPKPTAVPTSAPDKSVTVTTSQGLVDALAGDKEIINISGTLGSLTDYTAYEVNRAVTINGDTGNSVYGTFNVRSAGVSIKNVNLTIRGGGNDSLKNGINVATKSVTLMNNTFNLPKSIDTIGNGVVIWPMGTATPDYKISNNTFNGFDNKVPNWSSAAIVVAENITSNRLGDTITTVSIGIDETHEVMLAKSNTYNDCTYGYTRQDWSIGSDHVVTYTNSKIYPTGHVYIADGTYTANLTIDKDFKIIGTSLNSKILGTLQITSTTGSNVYLEKLTVEMPAAGFGANGIIGVTGNANVNIVDSKITTENKGQTTSVGVRMTGNGAKVTLKNTDIDVYYYGIGLRNINQELNIDGGTIDGWAALMTSAGGLGSKSTDTNTKIDIKNAYLNSTAVSNEAYAPVVLQEYYDKVTLTINNSTLNVGTPVVVGAEDKTSALEIRSFGNIVNVSDSTLIAKDATNEENKDTSKKAAAVVRIGGSNKVSEGAANTIKFSNTNMQSKEGEKKFVSYRSLGFQSIDNIWVNDVLLDEEEVVFINDLRNPVISNAELTYTETSEDLVVSFDLNRGYLLNIPVLAPEELASTYTALLTGDENASKAAAEKIGNDLILNYYYLNDQNQPVSLMTAGTNGPSIPVMKNKYWDGYLNYYNENGGTTKLPSGTIENTMLGVEIPKNKTWTTSTNIHTGTVADGWLNEAKGRTVYVDIIIVYNGTITKTQVFVSIPNNQPQKTIEENDVQNKEPLKVEEESQEGIESAEESESNTESQNKENVIEKPTLENESNTDSLETDNVNQDPTLENEVKVDSEGAKNSDSLLETPSIN